MPEFDGDPRNHGFIDKKVEMPGKLPDSVVDLVMRNLMIGLKTKEMVYINEAKRIVDIYRKFYDMKQFEEEWMWSYRRVTNHIQRINSLMQEPCDGDSKEVYP